MLKIGITGGIGSGKSLVSQVIQTLGYPVFNSDDAAKIIANEDPAVVKGLTDLFGSEVYTSNGLNRPFLAQKIFNNDALREQVNSIIHPRVRAAFDAFCLESSSPLIFNEAAILIETGASKKMDRLVLVTAPEAIRIDRVVLRDGVSIEEVQQRMSKQWNDADKRKFADVEIVNDGTTPLLRQIEKTLAYLTSSQGS